MEKQEISYQLGLAGASEEFLKAAAAGNPYGSVNTAFAYAEAVYSEFGAVYRPHTAGPLAALWEGDLEVAYREADTNLAIVLESAFSDLELGITAPTNNHGYTLA